MELQIADNYFHFVRKNNIFTIRTRWYETTVDLPKLQHIADFQKYLNSCYNFSFEYNNSSMILKMPVPDTNDYEFVYLEKKDELVYLHLYYEIGVGFYLGYDTHPQFERNMRLLTLILNDLCESGTISNNKILDPNAILSLLKKKIDIPIQNHNNIELFCNADKDVKSWYEDEKFDAEVHPLENFCKKIKRNRVSLMSLNLRFLRIHYIRVSSRDEKEIEQAIIMLYYKFQRDVNTFIVGNYEYVYCI